MMNQRIVKLPLFLFGSFAFSWVFGTVLHELGHAISMWLTGGTVLRITINPFSWSYTYYGSTPRFPAFSSWSGVVIGSVLGFILLLLSTRKPTPYLFPFVLTGILPILKGGGYYLVDILIGHQGDATNLVRSGTPTYGVVGAGVLWLVIGLYLMVRLINLSGIRQEDTFIHRLVFFGFGILPYFQLSAIYTLIYLPEESTEEIATILLAVALVVIVAFASRRLHNQHKTALDTTIAWKHVANALFLGIAAIVIPFLIFGH